MAAYHGHHLPHVSRRALVRAIAAGGARAAALALLSACGGSSSGTTAPTVPAASTAGTSASSVPAGSAIATQGAAASGKQIDQFAVDLTSDAASLDPGTQYDTSSYSVYGNIFDTLLTRDPKTAEIKPFLATSYKIVNDLTWEFKLKDGIAFHNGEPFNADAVKFSLERILSSELKSPQRANYALVDHVDVVDPQTVHVVTTQPFPTLSAYLTTHRVVPPKYTKEKGADYLAANPVGTGPYKFVEWLKGDHVTLEANSQYWNGTPPVKKVIFRTVPENSTRIANLLSGHSDFIFSINPDDQQRVTGQPNLAVLVAPTERVAYLMMQTMDKFNSPTKNPKLREAIGYAVDREGLLKALLQGQGKLTDEMLTPQHFGYDPSIAPYTYDPKKAKALMQEAGYGNGIKLAFLGSPGYAIGNLVVQALQDQVKQIGIELPITNLEFSLYLKKIQNQDWQDIRFGQWSCSCLDADGVINPLFNSQSGWSSYSNPDLDKDLTAGRSTLDPTIRKQAYSRALKTLRDASPGIPLWQVYATYGAKKTLKWQPTVDEQFYIMDMAFTG